MKATLALENGIWYEGEAAGAPGEAGGEVVFNTSLTGYQEILTDPSYSGQIVTMTAPEIGNYGVAPEDGESRAPQVAGFIVRDESPIASNWRASSTLRDYLVRHNVVAISDVDTRALTRVLRSAGVMRGIIATGEQDPRELVERTRAIPSMEGSDLVVGVTCDQPFDWAPTSVRRVRAHPGAPRRAAAEDRRLRLRHEVEHPAAVRRSRLRRPRVPGDDARGRPAGGESGRRVPEQRPGRSGGAGLRGRQRPRADQVRGAGVRHLSRAPGPVARARRPAPTS